MTDTEKAMVDLVIAQVNEGIKEAKDGGIPIGRLSDGYHTFDELYEHRIVNYMKVCDLINDMYPWEKVPVWMSKKHSDGSSFEGWFVLGIHTEKGKQITYHLPLSKWEECAAFARELPTAPEWDQHTSADVLQRLKAL